MAIKKDQTGGIWHEDIGLDEISEGLFRIIISTNEKDNFQPLHAFGRTTDECIANGLIGAAGRDAIDWIESYLDNNSNKPGIEKDLYYQQALQIFNKAYGEPYNPAEIHRHEPIYTGYKDNHGNKIMYPGKVQTYVYNELRTHDVVPATAEDDLSTVKFWKAGGMMLDTIYFVGGGDSFKFIPHGQEEIRK